MQKSENATPAELLTSLTQIGYTFGTLFAAAEFGEHVAHHFNQFHERFCDCDWYFYPISIQRIYVIVLAGVQDAVIIEGYANTVCTRDAFKNVIEDLKNHKF